MHDEISVFQHWYPAWKGHLGKTKCFASEPEMKERHRKCCQEPELIEYADPLAGSDMLHLRHSDVQVIQRASQ
ncbi:hypothetical protein thsrh120_28150 [Rhizobium sp. No.120]